MLLFLLHGTCSTPKMPQFDQLQRVFLAMEFHKRQGTWTSCPSCWYFLPTKIPAARVRRLNVIRDMHTKFSLLGTINDVNSAQVKLTVGVESLPQLIRTSRGFTVDFCD